ncbi:MAG: hypothetical protein U0414_22325 [Polyangiaceae bacterium]
MPNWRDELIDAVKTKVEREAEEAERQRQRVREAMTSAEAALKLGVEALTFASEQVRSKGKSSEVTSTEHSAKFTMEGPMVAGAATTMTIAADLDPATAIIKVTYQDAKAREFDFARDRHIASADVEEYLGRRVVELIRAAQKAAPW